MNDYIFAEHQPDSELRRLRRIETALDPHSRGLLLKTGISAGWKCLEVGAGGGSILSWLGERVGASGRAIGVDTKTTYLRGFAEPPFEIIEGDVREVGGRQTFDLVHIRYVLIHNVDATSILDHVKGLLRPGGHLVVEEPDFESAEWLDRGYHDAGERVNRAIRAMFAELSLDAGFGKRLPMAVSELGLAISGVDARSHLEPGAGPVALVMADSAGALRRKYVATGEATDVDVDRYIEGAHDPASWANYYSTIAVVAVNPS